MFVPQKSTVHQNQIPRVVRIRMIKTRTTPGKKMISSWTAQMGREYRSKFERIQIWSKTELRPPWTGTMGMDPHLTIQPKMRDMNMQNMMRNTPEGNMTRKASQNTRENPRTRIPEPWWWLHYPGLWNPEDPAMGRWPIVYSRIYTC